MWVPHKGASRSHVAWSSERPEPVRSCRNFGEEARASGHRRVPAPPAGITAYKPSMVGPASEVMAQNLADGCGMLPRHVAERRYGPGRLRPAPGLVAGVAGQPVGP